MHKQELQNKLEEFKQDFKEQLENQFKEFKKEMESFIERKTQKYKFKVGDYVIGNEKANEDEYDFANQGWIGKVTQIHEYYFSAQSIVDNKIYSLQYGHFDFYPFQVGSRVQFKTWGEMVQEYGVDCENDLGNGFIRAMQHLCGTYATIDTIEGQEVKLKDFTAQKETDWGYNINMIKPAVNEPYLWTFTEDEKVILRNLDEDYKWLIRHRGGEVAVYTNKPKKEEWWSSYWVCQNGINIQLKGFYHLFQNIEWGNKEPCEFRKFI